MLQEELDACTETTTGLHRQLRDRGERLRRERARSRELTSTMVGTRRAEDRSLLVSDEAVSHALASQHDDELTSLKKLAEKPYFARIVLNEEEPSGETRKIEYKIGYAANPDCRIIDWKKAPLSKLYYEYKEGDEYSETIQGRDRVGRIVTRNRVEISEGELKEVACRFGTFRRMNGEWIGAGTRSASTKDARKLGSLPEILSLISPEQFRAITKDSTNAVLIQGVAGSGKTTVALHRLAWLLDPGNSDVTSNDCVVLTLGPSLREYIRSSMVPLGISGVPVFTFREWCGRQITPHLPATLNKDSSGLVVLTPQLNRPSASVERVKRSMAVLRAIEEKGRTNAETFRDTPLELILSVLSDPRLVKSLDDSRLLNDDVIKAAYDRTREIESRGTLDRSDFSLILRALQVVKGRGAVLGRASPYKHVLLDEVQDYSPVELATILTVVTDVGNVTLVGDTSQKVEDGFPGWDKLTKWWRARKMTSSFVRLQVSHRSTQQIVSCASAIAGIESQRGGRAGRRPEWMFSRSSERALEAAIQWLTHITSTHPRSMIGVLCFSALEAKELHSLLIPTFGPLVRLGDDALFTFDEGIVVCDVYAAKGLEFFGVLVYQPSTSSIPQGEVGRNLLYIAATRAQDHLLFVTPKVRRSVLSDCSRSLLERIDLDLEVEEEEAQASESAEDS